MNLVLAEGEEVNPHVGSGIIRVCGRCNLSISISISFSLNCWSGCFISF